jgi:hypothetical protein
VRGAHHIGFGVNYIHTNANAATNLNTNATFAFTIQGTNLNGGLRWEPMLPAVMPFGWLSHFDLSSFLAGVKSIRFVNAPAGVLFPGDAHGPS